MVGPQRGPCWYATQRVERQIVSINSINFFFLIVSISKQSKQLQWITQDTGTQSKLDSINPTSRAKYSFPVTVAAISHERASMYTP